MRRPRKTFMLALVLAVAVTVWITGCGNRAAEEAPRAELILATTTSTQDSGLLDAWIPMFEEEYPYSVKVIAVGSGKAMEMGRNGECDVMLVHSPGDEEKMVEEGYAVNRRAVMHNDFVIVGPPEDPAGVGSSVKASDAMQKIVKAGAKFVSRGDNSGTHTKELSLWEEAGLAPSGPWYMDSGKGMGDTLRIVSQEKAYTLTDRGTFLKLKKDLDLVVLLEGDPLLFNYYHVMEVNPERWPDVNQAGARAFSDFVTGRKAQELLETFGVKEYGEPLFFPDAL
ncbi:MAG: substrate-binding domain-containing protein [Actinomycetota bacterium]|nr:substrate-binding domain-containing protein [Actinomycetota bacterium]